MGLLVRQTLAAAMILAIILAWWYPAASLLSLEIVSWEERLAQRYNPNKQKRGFYFRSPDNIPPLQEFIAAQTATRTITSTDPAWTKIIHSLMESENKNNYLNPNLPLFHNLTPQNRYIFWSNNVENHYLEYHFLSPPDYGQHNLSLHLKYPLRSWWPWFLTALALTSLLMLWPNKQKNLLADSTPAKGVRWSAIFFIFSLGIVLWPFIYNFYGSTLSYASMTIGTLLCLGGIISLWLFGRQLVLLKKILAGDHLVHFTYSPEEWSKFVHWNFAREAAEKKFLWWVIFVITLLVSFGLVMITGDPEALWVVVVLMCLMVLLRILAVGIPKASYKRHLKTLGQVYIHEHGLYLNGSMHSWNTWGTRLDRVVFKKSPLPHMEIVYSYLILMGKFRWPKRNYTNVRVPIPAGQEDKAKMIPKQLINR